VDTFPKISDLDYDILDSKRLAIHKPAKRLRAINSDFAICLGLHKLAGGNANRLVLSKNFTHRERIGTLNANKKFLT